MNSFVIFQVCYALADAGVKLRYVGFDKELVDLESSLITKDKYMIDDMKLLKGATSSR